MNMIDNLTGPMAKVSTSVDGSVGKIQSLNQTFGSMTKVGATMAGVGAQITSALLDPVESTYASKKALGELSSLGIKDLGALDKAARSFSDTWAGTTKADFITAAYDIKSGINSLTDVGVAQYTTLAGETAKGTKSSIAEMTSLFATGYGIYKDAYSKMSDLEFGEMFSAGISTAVQKFKTTGSGMSESIKTLGASATSAKVPLEEQLSILGMLQATMGGSEAGTKYKAFLRTAAQGGKELGLSFVDANNQLLSMPEILNKLRGKFGDTMDAAEKMKLQSAFGDAEAVSLIDQMYSKTGALQGNIVGMYSALGKGTGVTKEMANAINNTDPDKYQLLQQRLDNVKASLGNTLLPTINSGIGKIEEMLTKVDSWAQKNQDLVRVILLIALALGSFLTVGGTTIAVFGGIGLVVTKTIGFFNGFWSGLLKIPGILTTIHIKALYAGDGLKAGFGAIKSVAGSAVSGIGSVASSIGSFAKQAAITGAGAIKSFVISLVGMARQAITTAVTALPGLISSVWSFTAALLANPITWIVIGIVALIAVIILLWQNWDKVSAFISTTWNNVVAGVTGGINNLKTGIGGVITWITEKIAWFGESGKKIVDTLVNGIKSVAMKPVDAVKGIFDKVRKLLPFSDAKEGPLSHLTLNGRRVMETVTTGINQTSDMPSKAVDKSFKKVDFTTTRQPIKKVSLKETSEKSETESSTTTKEKGLTIEKFFMQIDFSKVNDLPKLLKLLKEMEDFINANGGSVDKDPTPEPA
jgi:TP901 family phage tail tape measure protein